MNKTMFFLFYKMAEIWFTHPLGCGVCFIKFENKEHIL
jgi:hypothetical protein